MVDTDRALARGGLECVDKDLVIGQGLTSSAAEKTLNGLLSNFREL
jgi:hypothetical protein